MKIDQLRIFVAVAEHGHVTRAARELGLTQSACSAAIAALEASYSTRLFDRVGRGIELTETGRRFLPEARAVLDRVAAARAALEDLSGLTSGNLSIATSQTIASYWLPRRLAAYHAAYPGIRLDVTIGNTLQVETAVVEGSADLGLVEGATRDPGLIRTHVDNDRTVLVVAADYRNLPEAAPGVIDIQAIPWIVREAGSGTRAVLEDLARARGLELDDLPIFMALPDNEAVRATVEAGAGATIISEHVVAASLAGGSLRAIPIDLPPREFAMVRHRDRHASRALVALLEQLSPAGNATEDAPARGSGPATLP